MAQGDAKLTEVALRQLRQNFGVDFALMERRLISTEAEAAKPTTDIHRSHPNRLGAMITQGDNSWLAGECQGSCRLNRVMIPPLNEAAAVAA